MADAVDNPPLTAHSKTPDRCEADFAPPFEVSEFRTNLLAWFDIHKRDLPWRRTSDPYAIWVSEIMLQQTRVAAVLDHYAKWMRRFPNVETLAVAPEDQVLAAWSGLGYYRRARFLHKGAQAVVADYNGKLPATAAALRKLPGIGPYTSAAIASIAFGEAEAVVDGNVERVLLRQTGGAESGAQTPKAAPGSAEIQDLASALLDRKRPGDFNQAMMELGATICLPKGPLCLQCPVRESCRTRGEHPTAARKSSNRVDVPYGIVRRQRNGRTQVLLEQRPSGMTVMPGMWELPRLESVKDGETPLLLVSHAIMQTNYRVSVIELSVLPPSSNDASRRWVAIGELAALPLTGLARKVLLRLGLLVRG